LKGKPVDELDDAALERKYPAELIVEKDCFYHYVTDGYFSWDFDSDLFGHKKYLTDYQRLVLLNGDVSISAFTIFISAMHIRLIYILI
jgi:hypothetical protein